MPWKPKDRRSTRRRTSPQTTRARWQAVAWLDLPRGLTEAHRERALASIRRVGQRFGIRIMPQGGPGAAKVGRRNSLLD